MRLATLLACFLLIPAALASAHGGTVVLDQADGKYSVTVLASQAEEGVDFTAYLIRQDLGEPDANAKVKLTLGTPDGERTVSTRQLAGAYEAIVPGSDNEWRNWGVSVAVSGANGKSAFSADPVSEKTPSIWIIGGISVVVIFGGGAFVLYRRSKQQEEPA